MPLAIKGRDDIAELRDPLRIQPFVSHGARTINHGNSDSGEEHHTDNRDHQEPMAQRVFSHPSVRHVVTCDRAQVINKDDGGYDPHNQYFQRHIDGQGPKIPGAQTKS